MITSKNKYEISEFRALVNASSRIGNAVLGLALEAVAELAVAGLTVGVMLSGGNYTIGLIGSILGLLLVGFNVYRVIFLPKKMVKVWKDRGNYTLRFDFDATKVSVKVDKDGMQATAYPYASMKKVLVTKDHVILSVNKTVAFITRKDAFPHGGLDTVLSWMKMGLGKRLVVKGKKNDN